MIDSIIIKNFKTHKDTTIEFCPWVNVLVGLSDHGKTNVIRALNWAAHNRPLGDGMINRNSTKAEVEVSLSHPNGAATVNRIKCRDNGTNAYILNGDTDHPFTAFGSDPPPQINDALNLSDINLQRQFEPYFLVFDPPGQVATFIRSITKLDEIDKVIANIDGKIRQNKIDVAVCENETSDILRNLGLVARIDIDGLQQRIDRAKQLMKGNDGANYIISRLSDIVRQIEAIIPIELPDDLDDKLEAMNHQVEVSIRTMSSALKMANMIGSVRSIKSINLPDDLDSGLGQVNQRTEAAKKLQLKFDRLSGIISLIQQTDLEAIELPDPMEPINRLSATVSKYNESVKRRDQLNGLIGRIQDAVVGGQSLVMYETSMASGIKDLRSQLTECPTCGSKLDEASKERLLHEPTGSST